MMSYDQTILLLNVQTDNYTLLDNFCSGIEACIEVSNINIRITKKGKEWLTLTHAR